MTLGAAPSIDAAAARAREIQEIVATLLKALTTNGPLSAKLLAAGKVHEIEQVFPQACAVYESLLAAEPGNLEAAARMAIVLLKTGNRLGGLEVAKQLVARNPDFTFSDISGRPRSAQTVLGDACRNCGDIAGAKAAYAAALELVSRDRHAATQLAKLYLAENSVTRAAVLAEGYLEAGDLAAFKATTTLLANNPQRLPAIAGILIDRARLAADSV